MQPLRILVIYDGKAGHLSQSKGLAQLLGKRLHNPCEQQTLRAKPLLKLFNRPLRWLAQALPSSLCKLLLAFYKTSDVVHQPNVIISFGGDVVALNIALSRRWHCPNILIGNHYGMNTTLIAAHLATAASNACTSKTIITGIGLSKIDREHCHQASLRIKDSSPSTQFWSLLIGGDGGGYRYQANDWQALANGLKILSQRHNIHWLICDSRRTCSEAMVNLRKILSPYTPASFIGCNEPDQPSIEGVLGAAERIFCSEDSLSMLSEAVSMNKPVISLLPEIAKPKGMHRKRIEHLIETGLIQRCPIRDLTNFEMATFAPKQPYDAQLDAIFGQLQALDCLANLTTAPGVEGSLTELTKHQGFA